MGLRRAILDGARGVLAGLAETRRHCFRALFQLPQQRIIGFGESGVNVAALFLERFRNALARLAEQVGELAGGGFQLDRHRILRVRQRRRNAVAIADDGFAFGGQFIEQHADAPLVFAIGALQRGNFAADDGFKFAGARQGPLDAVAHRRDFPADGLAQGHHLFRGDGFGFGEANRDFRHGAGGMAHFLGAARHRTHGDEEDDRPDQREDRRGGAGAEQRAGKGRAMREHDIADPQARPGGRSDDGRRHAGGIGPGLQALQDLADRGAVVVGRAAGRREGGSAGVAVARRRRELVLADLRQARRGGAIFRP